MNKKTIGQTARKQSAKEEAIVVYHNTRCSKSREVCTLLDKKKIPFQVIEYLTNPLNKTEIKTLLKKLNIKAEELVRKNELVFKEKFASKIYTEAQWVNILEKNPVLIQRPIVVKGNRAIIGRSADALAEIL